MPEGEGSLFVGLDAALQSGSSEKRVAVLRQVTDPFLSEAAGAEKLKIDFAKLSKPSVQRLLRFWLVREVTARSA
jgi:hypothetical protein